MKSSGGITSIEMDCKFIGDRKVFIQGEINDNKAMDFMKQIMYLNGEEDTPIAVYINSLGGDINSGMLMYDVIVTSNAPIKMFCTGRAYSMGAVLFACAKERYMLPNSELMIHQPLLGGQVGGNASSIKSISDSLLETKTRMNKILALHTGRTEEEVDEQTTYDHYFTPEEAVEWGLCDKIVSFKEMMEGFV
jgi:ATP-dependent Clp protease protease subunit